MVSLAAKLSSDADSDLVSLQASGDKVAKAKWKVEVRDAEWPEKKTVTASCGGAEQQKNSRILLRLRPKKPTRELTLRAHTGDNWTSWITLEAGKEQTLDLTAEYMD